MRLTPWERDRLTVFLAAELARRRRDRGLALTHPEAVALIADAMHEAARDGASYAEVESAGRVAIIAADVLPGVRELLDEVRLEVLLGDGTRVVTLVDPLGAEAGGAGEPREPGETAGPTEPGPGAIVQAEPPLPAAVTAGPDRERRTLAVANTGQRVVRVSSHFPFHRVNPRLAFDRAAAEGFHLDLEAGSSIRWAPGEMHEVELVAFGGRIGRARAGLEPTAAAEPTEPTEPTPTTEPTEPDR